MSPDPDGGDVIRSGVKMVEHFWYLQIQMAATLLSDIAICIV